MNKELLEKFMKEDYRPILKLPIGIPSQITIKEILGCNDGANHQFIVEYSGEEYIFNVGKKHTKIASVFQSAIRNNTYQLWLTRYISGTSYRWDASLYNKNTAETKNEISNGDLKWWENEVCGMYAAYGSKLPSEREWVMNITKLNELITELNTSMNDDKYMRLKKDDFIKIDGLHKAECAWLRSVIKYISK